MERSDEGRYAQLLDALNRVYPSNYDALFRYPGEVIGNVGAARGALLYAILFCPPFVEVDGMVFHDVDSTFRGDFDLRVEEVREALEESMQDRAEFEGSFNRLDLTDFFYARKVSAEEFRLLAAFVVTAWEGRLRAQYPDRAFVVEYGGSGDEELYVTFFEVEP